MFISSCFEGENLRAAALAMLLAMTPSACSLPKEEVPREHADFDALSLNEVQYVGTHNSYKLHPDALMMQALVDADQAQAKPRADEPTRAHALSYGHLPLETQLELGMRLFELDLQLAGSGPSIDLQEHYTKQYGAKEPLDGGVLPARFEPDEVLVYHGLDDFRSSCYKLTECLLVFRNWSRANPQHLPVVIYLEAKYQTHCLGSEGKECPDAQRMAQPFDRQAWERIERHVRSMIGEQKIVRPGDLLLPDNNLRQSIMAKGWPKIGELRGKFLFVIAAADDRAKDTYSEIDDPLLFTFRPADHPDASFVIEFDPFSPKIEEIIEAGLIASTYADYRLEEARNDDTKKRDRLFSAGAQMISTDFPIRDPRFSNYRVVFNGAEYVRQAPRIDPDQ